MEFYGGFAATRSRSRSPFFHPPGSRHLSTSGSWGWLSNCCPSLRPSAGVVFVYHTSVPEWQALYGQSSLTFTWVGVSYPTYTTAYKGRIHFIYLKIYCLRFAMSSALSQSLLVQARQKVTLRLEPMPRASESHQNRVAWTQKAAVHPSPAVS